MTQAQEIKLQKEYRKLRAEMDTGHSRLKWVKQRMAEIRRAIVVSENIVEERPDELLLKS